MFVNDNFNMDKLALSNVPRLKAQAVLQGVVIGEKLRQKKKSYQKKFKLPNTDTKKNNCNASSPGKALLTTTQYLFYETVKKIRKSRTHRGLIGWLSTGSGKTTIASGIINAFADTDKTIYYISKHDALKPHEEFVSVLDKMYGSKIENIKKRLKIISIASFSNRLTKKEIDLKKSVIIIDEAQYLFAQRAVPQFREKHRHVINTLLSPKALDAFVFVLTATPGDDTQECLTLLNLVRKKNEAMATMRSHVTHLLGKLFYLDMSKDLSIFPKVSSKITEHTLSDPEHLKRYVGKLKTFSKNNADQKQVKMLQKWSNNLFKTDTVSSKILGIYKELQQTKDEKHYVYSQYGKQGISDLVKFLESVGYKQANKMNMNTKSKKFILAKSSEGFVTSSEKNQVLKKFNSPENTNGEFISVFLATDSYNTGLDLKDVRHVHFMEPPLNYTDVIQGVGRGVRMCSHANLPKKNWTVSVNTHMSIPDGDSMSIDKTVHKKSQETYNDLNVILDNFKRYSLDCKAMHKFHGGSYKCANSKKVVNEKRWQ